MDLRIFAFGLLFLLSCQAKSMFSSGGGSGALQTGTGPLEFNSLLPSPTGTGTQTATPGTPSPGPTGTGTQTATPGTPPPGPTGTGNQTATPGTPPPGPTVTPAVTLSGGLLSVPGNSLGTSAQVSASWTATGATPAAYQVIVTNAQGIQEPPVTVPGNQTTYSFPWGDRTPGSFQVRVTATGIKGNVLSLSWGPAPFNSAIVTRSVECLFCHLRIEGDMGGLDFPASLPLGTENFTVTGKIYANTTIPSQLKPSAASGVVENYNNSDKLIFPKNLKFPVLSPSTLSAAMQGSLSGGTITLYSGGSASAIQAISGTLTGNVVIDGTSSPIITDGEVFVDGDVVIKGTYTGVGTLYANNIFILGDLIAKNSPFPFTPGTSTYAGTDALYLGAIKDVIVGDPELQKPWLASERATSRGPTYLMSDLSQNPQTISTPSAWFSQTLVQAFGQTPQQTFTQTRPDPVWIPSLPSIRNFKIDVNRIDSYIYAGHVFMWMSYANLLLNGGYMAPYSALSSALQMDTGHAWNQTLCGPDPLFGPPPTVCGRKPELINPRNGLPTHTNVVRFDQRLGSGFPGLEALKAALAAN